jgi:hypothetical protein
MMEYQQEQRRKAEQAEREAAEARKKAADALLAQAMEAEESGDALTAQIMAEAAASAESGKGSAVAVAAVPKAQGVQTRKNWKAKIVDDAAVPVSFAGMCLRPVDVTALNRLAVTSKGTMQVPGVVFYQEESIALR